MTDQSYHEKERERRFIIWTLGETTPHGETTDLLHAEHVLNLLKAEGKDGWLQNLSANQLPIYKRRGTVSGCTGCRRGGPSHDPSPYCESGKHAHCSCDTCF